MTKSELFARKLNKHITNSPSLYRAGQTFTFKQFRARAGHLFPKLVGKDPKFTADMPAFVNAYITLNKELAYRGIQIKATNYYTRFEVLEIPAAKKKVAHLRKTAQAKTKAANTLELGIRKYQGTWTPLTTSEVERVSHHIYAASFNVPYKN